VQRFSTVGDLLADRGSRIDCVVVDMEPNGMDSVDYLERLRDGGLLEPAIILAGTPSLSMRNRITAAGAILVEKPLLSDVLTATIRRIAGPISSSNR
jgi:FixJ family two-component response regulator